MKTITFIIMIFLISTLTKHSFIPLKEKQQKTMFTSTQIKCKFNNKQLFKAHFNKSKANNLFI